MQHLKKYEAFLESYGVFSKLNESVDPEARDKVRMAISLILVNLPFFSSILIRLWVVEDKGCDTMYTNGRIIAYSPKFVNECTTFETAWVLVHEIMHNVLLHFSRTKPNPKLWNMATDYAINLLIKNVSDNSKTNERFVMPKDALYDEKYTDMSAEAIYDLLEKNPSQQPKNFKNFGGVTGENVQVSEDSIVQKGDTGKLKEEDDSKDNGSGSNEEGGTGKMIELPAGSEVEMQNAVGQAIAKAPSSIRRYYDLLFKSKIDWKKELKKYIKQIFDKTRYKLPYRRFAHTGTYLTGPVKGGEAIDCVVVGIDTSGSIDNEMINEFLTEVAGIIQAYKVENLIVIPIDDEIRAVNKFKNPRDLTKVKVEIKGGGGTDFRPFFKWIENNVNNKFSLAVYITDAAGTFPSTPAYQNKVIWCVKGEGKVPFGKRIALGD